MADVLLARSDGIEGFERHVVIKRIRPELSRDQRFIRMFLDEARVAATLHHQNIVQVHDIGEASGEYFIAMEYVHGEDTRKLLANAARQRTHVPLGYAIATVSAAAAGLHHAHERCGSDRQPLNIVHRDVTPSNILIGYDGSIKIVDFGIATASVRPETRSGGLKGKLSYMSPEQCKGATVDRRTDVYALGVVLYELATTTRMIRGENDYLIMEQIVHGRIAPPQSRRPELPSELSDIILRALATDRDQRYATADELRIALDQFAWNNGLTAPTSSIAAYMRQQFGQRPEPWLEIGAPGATDVAMGDEQVPSSSWVDPPRDGEIHHTDSVPFQSGQLGLPPRDAISMVTASRRRSPTTIRPPLGGSEPAPPGPAPAPSDAPGFSGRRLALIAAAPVAAAVVWLVASVLHTDPLAPMVAAPPGPAFASVAAQSQPPAPATALPAPIAPPDAAVAAAVAAATAMPAVPQIVATAATINHDDPVRSPPEPASRKARTVSPPAAVRSSPPPADTPRARPDRSSRSSLSASTDPAPRDAGDPEPEVERPSAPPPPPPVTPTPTPAPPPTLVAVAPAPSAPAAPQLVAPAALDANRVAGDKVIPPDSVTMDAISRAGSETLVSTYKICVAADGTINLVTQMKSTGFPAYDEKIRSTIRRDWRYRPFLINGKASPVCTALRFVYSQK